MKQIYILLILFFTCSNQLARAQSCVSPVLADASAPSGTTSVNLGCGSGVANMSATFNGQGTVATSSYGVTSIPFSFTTFTGTTIPIATDDIWSANISIPFNFCFFGNTYNSLLVGSNGIVSFDVSTAFGTCAWQLPAPIPSGSYARASIMGVYTDIDPRFGSPTRRIQYTTVGVAPCRQFIVSFEDIAYYSSSCPSTYANFQIILNETSNIIDVQILSHSGCSSTNSGKGIVGIQDFNRTTAFAAPGRNNVTFSTSNEAWRFTPIDTSNSFRRMIVHLFENGILVDSATPYYAPFPTLRADFMRTLSFPPDSHIFHIELSVYDSVGASLCTVPAGLYDFNDLLYYSSGSLTISATTSRVSCFGYSDGAIDVTASSTSPPISYVWSDGATTEDRSGLSAGTYTLTASDLAGCVQVRSYIIDEPYQLSVIPINTQDASCLGSSNGSIDVMIVGGTMPYFPLWSNGMTTESIYGLVPDIYCLTVTDSSGCTATYCDTVFNGLNDSTYETIHICSGDFIIINGISRGSNGIYADTFTSIAGCDSVHYINLMVGSSVYATVNPTICLGDTYTALGINYTSTGIYHDTTTSISGCDSILTINLTVNSPSSFINNVTRCLGESVTVGSHNYSTNGMYFDTLLNYKGCDSFILTNLSILLPSSIVIDTTICSGTFIAIGSHNYFTSGTYHDTLSNYLGCDSSITLNLFLHPTGNSADTFEICEGQSIIGYSPANDTTITQHYLNIYGCDSTHHIFIDVHVLPKIDLGDDRNIYVGDTVLLVAVSGFNYNWSNGSTSNQIFVSPGSTTTYSVTISDSLGCEDSGEVVVNVFSGPIPIGFPSAFTPNGDGLNDYFYPILPIGSTLTTMIIYNRWGGVVYSGTSAPGWDGTFGGIPQPTGNYIYYMNITVPDPLDPTRTIVQTYTGTITLIR